MVKDQFQAQMNYIICSAFVFILLLSCNQENNSSAMNHTSLLSVPTERRDIIVEKSHLVYKNRESIWTLKGEAYSGSVVSYFPDSTLKEEMTLFNGKRVHVFKQWHANGKLKQLAHYLNGQLHGDKKIWSSEAILLSHLNYEFGQAHGKQLTWYPSGELHKELNLNMGKEEGIQKAYRKNGALYANYESKEGRIFGLKKSMLCFGLDNELVQYEN